MSASKQDGNEQWWKTATIYQIYPASFMDSNGDGIGDLPGILSKLDYVKSIGVDAIWISPFYDTMNEDQGYDISDYQKPLAEYGTLEDVEAIIDGCHKRGLKILFDLVINHTSREHKWFKESRKSKDNPYRKYYIWQPPRYIDGERHPPTNWEATFGGSAWEWDETTQEYYLHTFVIGQPDLNFTDAEVREAIWKEAVLFWLDKGIDGMRIDVSNFYSKGTFEDVEVVRPTMYLQPAAHKWIDGPRILEYLSEMQEKTFSKYGAVTLAEMPGKRTLEQMLNYVSEKAKVFNMAITFELMGIDHGVHGFYRYYKPWKLTRFKEITAEEQTLAMPEHGAWVNNYLENHDQARSVSRFMNDSPEYRVISAKTLAIYLLTLSGTPCIYEGEEIGITNFSGDWSLEEYVDSASQLFIQTLKDAVASGNKDITVEGGFDSLKKLARDHARTPMQWSSDKMGGFSTASKTWMRVNDNYTEINAAAQEDDPNSVLNFYRKMLKLRQEHKDSMVFGVFELLDKDNESTMTYLKKGEKETVAVVLNFSGKEQSFSIPGAKNKNLVVSSALNGKPSGDKLAAYEGRVYVVTA